MDADSGGALVLAGLGELEQAGRVDLGRAVTDAPATANAALGRGSMDGSNGTEVLAALADNAVGRVNGHASHAGAVDDGGSVVVALCLFEQFGDGKAQRGEEIDGVGDAIAGDSDYAFGGHVGGEDGTLYLTEELDIEDEDGLGGLASGKMALLAQGAEDGAATTLRVFFADGDTAHLPDGGGGVVNGEVVRVGHNGLMGVKKGLEDGQAGEYLAGPVAEDGQGGVEFRLQWSGVGNYDADLAVLKVAEQLGQRAAGMGDDNAGVFDVLQDLVFGAGVVGGALGMSGLKSRPQRDGSFGGGGTAQEQGRLARLAADGGEANRTDDAGARSVETVAVVVAGEKLGFSYGGALGKNGAHGGNRCDLQRYEEVTAVVERFDLVSRGTVA